MVFWTLFMSILLLCSIYLSYSLYRLSVNYRTAKQLQVPLVIIPVSPENPFWLLFGNRIASVIERVFGQSHFTRFSIRGFVFYDKYRAAVELGQHFAIVTPDKIWFFVCNAETLVEIFQRRSEFPRPLEILSMLDVFGPNVSTVEGADWQRHRKITGSPFTDQNSNLVWVESIRQASQVLDFWTSQEKPITSTAKHIRILSLHVLSGAGFGKFYSFSKASEPPKPGHTFNYRDSLAMILDHIMLILVVGPKLLTSEYLPESWARIGKAIVDFKAYMTDMYIEEKQSMRKHETESVNIMTSLVHAAEAKDGESFGGLSRGLSEAEIYGNTFVYNFAGHDTTAITFGWTVYLLAAHPEVQDWIFEEIREYLPSEDTSSWNYNDSYPKLKRCLAVLFEVLRLYNPLPGIIKSTGENSPTINLSGKKVILPAGIRVILNTDAIHTLPCYWGNDSLDWKPQRWIVPTNDGRHSLKDENFVVTQPGTYAPWSGGPRICPGKKFGQVEFVAVMATLFRRHRVEPVPFEGETMQQARARALSAVKDSGMILLLQMLHPEKVGLRWVLRDSK